MPVALISLVSSLCTSSQHKWWPNGPLWCGPGGDGSPCSCERASLYGMMLQPSGEGSCRACVPSGDLRASFDSGSPTSLSTGLSSQCGHAGVATKSGRSPHWWHPVLGLALAPKEGAEEMNRDPGRRDPRPRQHGSSEGTAESSRLRHRPHAPTWVQGMGLAFTP